jgi:hypothetical protein
MADKAKKQLRDQLGLFIQQYGRKKNAGQDPNDRAYDRKLEKKIRKMDPMELDALLRDDQEDQ